MSGTSSQPSRAPAALLVVDMQRYFLRPDHSFGARLVRRDPQAAHAYFARVDGLVIPNVQRLLQYHRELGAPSVLTRMGSAHEDGSDLPLWVRRFNRMAAEAGDAPYIPPLDDQSCAIDDRLASANDDLIITKTTSGAVGSTELDQVLRRGGVERVLVAGVLTNICVAQTARELADRDFDVLVVDDACAATSMGEHTATLRGLDRVFATVVVTDHVVTAGR